MRRCNFCSADITHKHHNSIYCNTIKKGLTDIQREEWKQTLKELMEDILLQLKRQDFSAATIHNIIG